jgi:hypothetical protein
LSSLNLLEQTLEPTERRCVTADPEKFYTTKGAKATLLLAVPDVLEDRRKGSHTWAEAIVKPWKIEYVKSGPTNASTDQDRNLTAKNVLRRCSVRAINAYGGQGASSATDIKFYKVTTSSDNTRIFLGALHCRLGHGSNNGRANAETITECARPITDLTDMDRNIWIFGSRCDCKLMMMIRI